MGFIETVVDAGSLDRTVRHDRTINLISPKKPTESEAMGSTSKLYQTWPFFIYLLRTLDILTLVVAASAARSAVTNGTELWPKHSMLIYFVIVISQLILKKSGSYDPAVIVDLGRQLRAMIVGLSWTALATLGGSAIDGFGEFQHRQWIYVLFAVATMVASRVAIHRIVSGLLKTGALRERAVIVGAGDRAARIINHIEGGNGTTMNVVGLFDDRRTRVPTELSSQITGSTEDLLNYVRREHVDRVIVTIPWTAEARVAELLSKLRTIPCKIDLCPTNVIWDFESPDINRIAGIPLVTVANRQVSAEARLIKWLEDQIIVSLVLIALAPVLLTIAVWIKLDSPGPVIFKQKRFGYNNQVFNVLKFRTMRHETTPEANVQQATRRDPRVTRIGGFLRRTSLDELPQLINVLRGEMSLVGPRPHAVAHNLQYASIIDQYFTRHNYKPGMTGWAQVRGLRGETDTPEKMKARVDHDIYYIEHWSIWLDIKILMLTPISVLFGKNAY